MWVAASFGFLMPAVRPPKTIKPGDNRTMQIRARRSRDLDVLRAEYMKGQLGPTLHTPDMDYEYRAYCVPSDFALAMARMVTEIDYGKFKPTTDRYEDDELHSCYNAIWSVVLNRLSTDGHRWSYWTKNPPAAKTTGKGYPKAVAGGASLAVDGETVSFLDSERQRLDEWLERRDTSADRDTYEPDLSWNDDDTAVVSTGNPAADALYAEIDAILEEQKTAGPIDHSTCEHPQNRRANARCRAAHRQAEDARITEIRKLIDQSYEDFKADFQADPDDISNWKGYVWEGERRS